MNYRDNTTWRKSHWINNGRYSQYILTKKLASDCRYRFTIFPISPSFFLSLSLYSPLFFISFISLSISLSRFYRDYPCLPTSPGTQVKKFTSSCSFSFSSLGQCLKRRKTSKIRFCRRNPFIHCEMTSTT